MTQHRDRQCSAVTPHSLGFPYPRPPYPGPTTAHSPTAPIIPPGAEPKAPKRRFLDRPWLTPAE
eukprot:198880-Prorocentrum_lima.AAC.1